MQVQPKTKPTPVPMPVEQPLTLPVLDIEKDAYPIESFPEFKGKVPEKKPQSKPEVAPKVEGKPSYKMPVKKPQQDVPQTQVPAPYVPQMMPCFSPCMQQLQHFFPGQYGCQTCGQPIHQPFMPTYQQPVINGMPYHTYSPMAVHQQQMYQNQMLQMNEQMMQQPQQPASMAANQPTTFPAQYMRQADMSYPEPPVMNQGKEKSGKTTE